MRTIKHVLNQVFGIAAIYELRNVGDIKEEKIPGYVVGIQKYIDDIKKLHDRISGSTCWSDLIDAGKLTYPTIHDLLVGVQNYRHDARDAEESLKVAIGDAIAEAKQVIQELNKIADDIRRGRDVENVDAVGETLTAEVSDSQGSSD